MKAFLFAGVALAVVPACSVYGDDLFGSKDPGRSLGGEGGDRPTSTGGAQNFGGTSSGGGSPNLGGEGGEASGGTGSAPACKGSLGLTTLALLDDFDGGVRQSGGDFAGTWASYGNGSGLTPSQDTSWVYDHDECLESDDTSLHVVASGYDQWTQFILDLEENVDLSGYDGVVFWGRSSGSPENSVRFMVRNDTSLQKDSIFRTLSKDGWRKYTIPFPDGVARDKVNEFWLLITAADSFDFWIDDLSFYKN